MKNLDQWDFPRIISSSRILLIIILFVISFSLYYGLDKKNLLILSLLLLVVFWINLLSVLFRVLDHNYNGIIKLRKLVFLFAAAILVYSFFYYAVINYYNIEYTTNKNKSKINQLFDSTYMSTSILTFLGIPYTSIQESRLANFVIMTQNCASIILITILLSKVIL